MVVQTYVCFLRSKSVGLTPRKMHTVLQAGIECVEGEGNICTIKCGVKLFNSSQANEGKMYSSWETAFSLKIYNEWCEKCIQINANYPFISEIHVLVTILHNLWNATSLQLYITHLGNKQDLIECIWLSVDVRITRTYIFWRKKGIVALPLY